MMKLIPQSEIEKAALNNSIQHYIMAYSDELHEYSKVDFEAGVKFAENHIIDQLSLLIQMNEDDFDRGKGKYILQQFIKDRNEV